MKKIEYSFLIRDISGGLSLGAEGFFSAQDAKDFATENHLTGAVIDADNQAVFDRFFPYISVDVATDGTAKVEKVAILADDPDFRWAKPREKRERLLSESDWTQMPDSPLTATQKTAWAVYRQALRDITTQADPAAIKWPVDPDKKGKTS